MIAKPVHVDEILTQSHSFKLDTTVSYANIQRANGISSPYTYQTQNGDFVAVPTYAGEAKTDQDYLNYSFTLRYGVTKDLELFTSANLYSSKLHASINDTFETKSDSGFNALNIGLTYQLKKESDTPSFLLGVSATAMEKTKFQTGTLNSNFKGYRVFATSFYTVDPVVFLVSSSYGINLKKEYKESSINSSDILTISPQVYFAVNPYTSLSGGFKYTHFAKDTRDNKQVSQATSNLSMLLGLSYEFSAKTVLNLNAEYLNTNDMVNNTISTSFSYKF